MGGLDVNTRSQTPWCMMLLPSNADDYNDDDIDNDKDQGNIHKKTFLLGGVVVV